MINASKILAVLLSLGLGTPAQAFCQKPVQLIKQGEAANCEGWLFSKEKEQELRLINEEYKLLTKRIEIYEKELSLYQANIKLYEEMALKEQAKTELWKTRAEDLSTKYVAQENGRGWRDMFFLFGGVVLTVAAGWALGQAAGGK